MTTCVSTAPLPSLPGSAIPTLCVYNPSHTHVAVSNGSQVVVTSIREGLVEYPDDGFAGTASTSGAVVLDEYTTRSHGRVTGICFLDGHHGFVLACGTETGGVMVCGVGVGVGEVIRYSTSGVVCMERVGGVHSTMVAVGYADGLVRIFACGSVGLRLHSVLQSPAGVAAGCVGGSEGVAEGGGVLLVGYSGQSGSFLRGYRYDVRRYRWEDESLGIDVCGGEGRGRISAISWAPLMGRGEALVAVAVGQVVRLYGLKGEVGVSVDVREVAELDCGAEVVGVGWNLVGTWLAVSTVKNEVSMWRADLAGEWRAFNRIVGQG